MNFARRPLIADFPGYRPSALSLGGVCAGLAVFRAQSAGDGLPVPVIAFLMAMPIAGVIAYLAAVFLIPASIRGGAMNRGARS